MSLPDKKERTLDKIDKALQHVYELCQGKKFTMRVPVDQEQDSDVILCDALESARRDLSAPSTEQGPAIPESRFEEIELWVGEYGHFRLQEEDYKAREVFKRIRAAIRRLAVPSATAAMDTPTHAGYADDDELFGNTIDAYVNQRLECDAEEMVIGFEFSVDHIYSRSERWRVTSGPTMENPDQPTEVERVASPDGKGQP